MESSKIVNISIVFIAAIILIETLQQFQSFVRPFVFAIIIAFLIMPLVRWCKKKQIPFWLILIGIIVGFCLIVVLLAALLSSDNSLQEPSIADMSGLQEITLFGRTISLEQFVSPDKIQSAVSAALTFTFNAAKTISSELLLILLFLIFLLPSYEIFLKDIEKHLSRSNSRKFKQAVLEIEVSIKEYLATKTVISLGTAIASGIILWAFGAQFVIPLALLIFVLNYIPSIGSLIAVVIAIIIAALTSGINVGLGVMALLLVAVQFIFGNILEPKIAGNKLNLSPIVILLGLFLWGWIWGVVGMLLAVPLLSITKIVLEHIEETKTIAKFMS